MEFKWLFLNAPWGLRLALSALGHLKLEQCWSLRPLWTAEWDADSRNWNGYKNIKIVTWHWLDRKGEARIWKTLTDRRNGNFRARHCLKEFRILRLKLPLLFILMDISVAGDAIKTTLLFFIFFAGGLLSGCFLCTILSTVVNAGAKQCFQGHQSNYGAI